jgi:H/ACA ribonucleoprotein complex subunit 3
VNIFLSGQTVALTDADLLGVGGEGRVYRAGSLAVKIFHDATTLATKLPKLRAFPKSLPPNVIAPVAIADDVKTGKPVGYAMPLVTGATDLLRLSQRRWRERVVSNRDVTLLFRHIHATLRSIQKEGVVVGDLNDANVVFGRCRGRRGVYHAGTSFALGRRGVYHAGTSLALGSTPTLPPLGSVARGPYFIDADSMQFGAFPCTVAHERFLDPRFYGRDLTHGGVFSPESDWYAFSVLLFECLLYVHPYGGQHASLPTLLRRAEARHSILQPDVKIPRAAAHYSVLPDDMLHWFAAVFDADRRDVFPERLLDAAWTRCACGTEHARLRCPSCAMRAAAVPAAIHARGCRVVSVFRTRGRIVAARMQGGLRWAALDEYGVIRREDGARVAEGPLEAGDRVEIAGPSTFLARGDRLAHVLRERVRSEQSIATFANEAAFAAGTGGCVAISGDWLVDAETGARIGQVIGGQTWVRAGDRLGFGFYRAGRLTFHFVFTLGKAGIKHVALPPFDGRLVDASAAFDDTTALFSTAVEKDGKRVHAMHLVAEDGSVLATESGPPEKSRMIAQVGGKCVAHGSILCATDDGLLLVRADPKAGLFVEKRLFSETRSFVSGGDDLLAGPGGSVYLVDHREIRQLSLT